MRPAGSPARPSWPTAGMRSGSEAGDSRVSPPGIPRGKRRPAPWRAGGPCVPAALRIPADGIQAGPRGVALGLFLRVLMGAGPDAAAGAGYGYVAPWSPD